MPKPIGGKAAAALIPAGAVIMFGGFLGCGNPHRFIVELAELGTKDLTVICNDGALPNGPDGDEFYGVAKLIHNKQVKKLICTHVGTNPEVARQMNEGTLDVSLIPQGSFAEMIRAGGAGLGGVLTPTGYGTIVREASHVHSVVEIDGRHYLLERPLRADYAVVYGYKVDPFGNVWYKGTTRNFSPWMAMAADTVIVEAENLVGAGEIEPENIITPGVLVDYIMTGREV
ncbi:MAG: CoA transferase subunit A [Peptococcaceae bacterium]|jgi:acetate CoA/acetoacetate CoA-transferase alpha subunit|nr:CoA transferase subunit A [Peptococcaceae bacterium]